MPRVGNGNFSLAILIAIGIFYPAIVHGIQTKRDELTALPIYNASFDFALEEHSQPRAHVVPARFYFTATDSEHVYSLSSGDTAYTAWKSVYPTELWGTPEKSAQIPGYYLALSANQIRPDTLTSIAAGKYIATSNLSGVAKLETFSNSSIYLNSPDSSRTFSSSAPNLPLTMIQSRARIYVCWVEYDPDTFSSSIKITSTSDGVNFVGSHTLVATGNFSPSIGVSGCSISHGSDEYIAVTYAKSSSEANILTFKAPPTVIDPPYPATYTTTIGLTDISSREIAVTQNPRTSEIIISWLRLDGDYKGYYRTFSFTPNNTWTPISAVTLVASGFSKNYGVSVESYTNFENTFVIPSATELKSYTLRDSVSAHDNFSPAGYATQFNFTDSQKHYAGLLSYDFINKYFYFYKRELRFPDEGRWDKTSKTLHLEGPPWPNTLVKIEYEFTEVATDACIVHMVNANGGRQPFNNMTGVIASSASALYTVEFDYNMDTGLYAGYMNNKIRMLDSLNNPVNISYVSGTSTGISFRPVGDLTFNTSYRIEIASDVIDARGTQIWEPVTLNFTTQKSSSSVIASEVKNITAWRDAARTQQIASGGDASATADIYIRLDAVDPAFNTIDTATVSILLNGAQIAQATLTQLNATSNYFDGYYKLATALATDSVYTFKAHPDSATTTSVIISFPTFSPIYPASGSTSIPGLPTIRIKASEAILPGDISATTVKLLKGGVEIAASRSYNAADREILLTPTETLESETTYTVSVSGLRDAYFNTQKTALSYQFTVADIKPPTITGFNPTNGETEVTIDRLIVIDFSEALLAASASKSSVKLSHNAIAASYSVIINSNRITISPDDVPGGSLLPEQTYALEITTGVTDLAGNGLAAAFNLSFTTQPKSTAPTDISTMQLYKDALMTSSWGPSEKVPASATIYLKLTGTDGATQTRDLATATLSFSWGAPAKTFSLLETASDSTGIYFGSFNLGSIPVYGLPGPLPPVSIGSLTFSAEQKPAVAATLTLTFPALIPEETLVNSVSGQVPAADAVGIRVDSSIILSFSDQLLDAGNALSLAVASGATAISGTRTLSADKRKITFLPDSTLPYASKMTVTAAYAADGLKSQQGNPLHRAVNFSFNTQNAQTQPTSITQVNLFPDATYSSANSYLSNEDFPRSGSIYIEARGPDLSANTIDFTMVNISTGASLRLDETGANTGIYRGIYNYPSLADGFVFIVSSAVTPAASQTLVLTIPSLTPYTPASGSVGVSIGTSIKARASEPVDPTAVNNTNVRLFRDGIQVNGAASYNAADMEIVFTPAELLATSTQYVYRISGISDLAGNLIDKDLVVSFTTQAETAPPKPPLTMKVYSDNAYSNILTELAYVKPGSPVFIEVSGADESAASIDSTTIQQSSTLSGNTELFTLIETGANTGKFRGPVTVFNEESALIKLVSITDPTASASLRTYPFPKITSLSPASGTATIVYLNQIFTITTSKDVAADSLTTATVRLSDSSGIASYALSLSDPRTIVVKSDIQPDSLVTLRITSGLKDTNTMDFPETVANYTSISHSFSNFGIYSDAGMTSLLAQDAEVEVGQTVFLLLEGTDTRPGVNEQATATLKTSLPDQLITLTETSPGRFSASFVIPALPEETIEITPESRSDLARALFIMPTFTILSYYPTNGAFTLPADSLPVWNFSRAVRSSDVISANFSIKNLSTNAAVAGTLSTDAGGTQVRFQPTATLNFGTEYEMTVAANVRDTANNTLGAALVTRFTTVPRSTPPSDIQTITLYKDPLLISGWGLNEKIPASATVYLKVTATDGSVQTQDLATATLTFSWGAPAKKISLQETASNSTGIYLGSFDTGSIPLYGIPTPLPPTSAGSLTFSVDLAPAKAATLTVTFPDLIPAETLVNGTAGQVVAANASSVRIDSPIILSFTDQLLDGGNPISLSISSGSFAIAGTRTLSADRRKITFQPDSALPYSSKITVSAPYAADGLRSMQGNPLYRAVNFAFTTQASQAQPVSISQVNLFPDSSYSSTSSYESNDDFPRSGSIYVEARGPDASPNTVDFTMVNISTGASLRLDETSAASGIFRGVYNYASLADGFVFIVSSAVTPAASQTLLLSIPSLIPVEPASGSTGVSINTSIRAKGSETLDPATINSSNVKLFKGSSEVAGAVSYIASEKEIVFTPSAQLATSTLYVYRMSGIKDLAGNAITSNLVVSFTTQAETTPPTPPITLKVFANSDYTGELADLSFVIPGSQVFAEISATDVSATAIDSTMVRQSSNQSAGTSDFTLIETGVNTGTYRGTITIFNEENAQLSLTSLTDTNRFLRLNTYSYPQILSFSPASGTANVYLNRTFIITTNKNIDAATLSTSTIRLSDSSGAASYSLTLTDPTTITISSDLEPASAVILRVTPGLRDTDGMSFPDTVANYTSVSRSFSNFRLYSDVGLTSLLAMGAEVEAGQTVYLRLDGNDTRFGEVEQATATFKSSAPDQLITLDEVTAGRFTGNFVIPDLPEETVEIVPENRTDLARTLKVLPAFALISYSPASGAITVPADSWPTWNFSRPVNNADITDANFSLKNAVTGFSVPGSLSTSSTGRQVRFQPDGLLALLTHYDMSVSAAIRDNSGNLLGEGLTTRFTTQPPPAPPNQNISLANYESAQYATQTLAVANNDSLYLELVADDTSFSTYETARVRLESSDGSLDGLELTLVENAPPSGIYRLALPINLPAGTTIKVQSQGDPTKSITITAYVRTVLVSMNPASGSSNLFLDQPITLNFSHSIDRSTAANGLTMMASAATDIPLHFSWADSDRSIIITPDVAYASSTRHSLQRLTNLRDTNGLFLLPDTAWLTMRGESTATLELLTGIAPRNGQSVSLTGEATPGNLVLLATTTNMFETYAETRTVQLTTASGSSLVTLAETAPGSFRGEFSLADDIVGNITSTLLFAAQPALTFNLAPLPAIVSAIPASGSSGIAELPVISAIFSRKLAFESTNDALRILTDAGNIVTRRTSPDADSTGFSWLPLSPLPMQSTCTLQLSGLTDYLGQSMPVYQHPFTTSGRQGISLFSDNAFAQLIATDQVDIPVVFVEVAASGTLNLTGRTFDLLARTGTRATYTVNLQLEAYNTESGRFRCSLEFAPGKAVPQYPLALLPGEWLELSSPVLTDDVRVIYYMHSGSVSPLNITGIRLYSEKHFAQRVTDTVANPSLFIEVEAEDRNWFTTDTTRIRIYSEADPTGLLLDLIENGTHSSQFRNFVRLSRDNSDAAVNNLKVLPAQKIYIESVTDPAVKTSILYLPVNTIKMMSVYPSPARGNKVNFRFYLNFPAYVDLKIFDTAGHEVFSTDIRGVEGENVYEWSLPRKIANGTYFYTVRIDNESGFPDAKRRVRGKFAILR